MYGEGASLMYAWAGAEQAVLIDAVRSGSSAGRIHRLDAGKNRIPSEFFNYSTHAFGVAEAVEMARVLEALPPQLVIYGMEGKNFAAGAELSPRVASAVDEVTQRVTSEFCDHATAKKDVEVFHA